MESSLIETAEKMEDEMKAQFKTRKKKGKKKVRGTGGEISKRVEDRRRICRRRTSFPGSVSVTGKRSLVCCSHIQVLM